MINLPYRSFKEENLESMTEEMSRIKTGQVTYAVRNTVIDDEEIHRGDIMGIGNHGILADHQVFRKRVNRDSCGDD